jgi:hypothetical protein
MATTEFVFNMLTFLSFRVLAWRGWLQIGQLVSDAPLPHLEAARRAGCSWKRNDVSAGHSLHFIRHSPAGRRGVPRGHTKKRNKKPEGRYRGLKRERKPASSGSQIAVWQILHFQLQLLHLTPSNRARRSTPLHARLRLKERKQKSRQRERKARSSGWADAHALTQTPLVEYKDWCSASCSQYGGRP